MADETPAKGPQGRDAPVLLEQAHAALLEAQERRRPGRLKSVNQGLIPLLRRPVPDPAEAEALLARDFADASGSDEACRTDEDDPYETDDIAPARGVLVAMALSVPLWGMIFAFVHFVF